MTEAAIKKSDNSAKYAITLTEPVVNNLIKKTEDNLLEIMMKKEQFQPLIEKKKAELEEIQKQVEPLNEEENLEKIALESLIRLKTSDASYKAVKMYHSLSNTTHKTRVRSRDGNIPWTRTINELLTTNGAFMTEDEIYAAILAKHPSWAFKSDLLKKKYFRYYFRDNIIKGKLKGFAFFNGMFGLSHWMENGTIKPKYLKQFVYGSSN